MCFCRGRNDQGEDADIGISDSHRIENEISCSADVKTIMVRFEGSRSSIQLSEREKEQRQSYLLESFEEKAIRALDAFVHRPDTHTSHRRMNFVVVIVVDRWIGHLCAWTRIAMDAIGEAIHPGH